jgi:hypothetical protein
MRVCSRRDLAWDDKQLRLHSVRGSVLAAIEPDREWPGHVARPSSRRIPQRNGEPIAGQGCWRIARVGHPKPASGGRMSGRRSRSKGVRTERSIVNALKASGTAAVRVPLSSAVGGRFAGDIVLPLMGHDLCVEVKARANGFRELYCWLNERDVLIVKADRQEPLVILRLSLATDIARKAAA